MGIYLMHKLKIKPVITRKKLLVFELDDYDPNLGQTVGVFSVKITFSGSGHTYKVELTDKDNKPKEWYNHIYKNTVNICSIGRMQELLDKLKEVIQLHQHEYFGITLPKKKSKHQNSSN